MIEKHNKAKRAAKESTGANVITRELVGATSVVAQHHVPQHSCGLKKI